MHSARFAYYQSFQSFMGCTVPGVQTAHIDGLVCELHLEAHAPAKGLSMLRKVGRAQRTIPFMWRTSMAHFEAM